MGQCVSHKAASAFQRPVAAHHQKKKVMHKNGPMKKSPDYEINTIKKTSGHTKGITTSFGFRRRPITAPAIANNVTAAKRLAKQEIIDRNGNSGDTESLTHNAIPPGRTTPKLAPPKKEANASKINRFGFRQPNTNRLNKISDINLQLENKNNNHTAPTPQQLRFAFQSTQLPRPQVPVHVLDTKTAKTIANHCKKVSSRMYLCENNSNSSKDGSFTEDSGVGSHASSGNGENDTLHGVDLNDSSPVHHKPRRFDVVLSGLNFDLRDLDETTEPPIPIPSLPSAFQHNTGFVQNRRFEYEKQLHRRKISSSSDGFSDDYCNLDNAPKTFLKTLNNREISPYSSDQESWLHGGEAMADDTSYSCSSSDDISTPAIALQNFMNASITNKTAPLHEIRNVLLTIEDPKFAAVANSIAGNLLDDETSPVDSLVCSYSESEDLTKHYKLNNDIMKTEKSLSHSKDVNEKDGSSSPGSPTNASNSLSLSDGKDYFDDEIADQPALVFDDTLTSAEQQSENTLTLIDSTPKPKRKYLGSPLLLRKKNLLNSTASVDTLSPCESIASDDLMMDFDRSQSSGLDDNLQRIDTHQNSLSSLEDTPYKPQENKFIDSVWAVCVGSGSSMGSPKSTSRPSRLLQSRGSTSSSSKPESPCSLDSHINSRNYHTLTRSPLRLSRPTVKSQSGYDSDDCIKLDWADHDAMIQDTVEIKTMLIKLRRIINERADEDYLKKSNTLNPFDNQQSLKNGPFNGLSSENTTSLEEDANSRFEIADLRRQVLFLQDQLEDKEQNIRSLQDKMEKLVLDTETAKSAPASTISSEVLSTNAATQTERIRPMSAGPSLLQMSPADGSMGSLVSVSERKFRSYSSSSNKQNQPSLWRKPGEPPLPQSNYGASSINISKRANSPIITPLTPV